MPDWLPAFITPQFITSVAVILVVIHVIAGGAAYLILLERKVAAWVQDRVGPNRVGPLGLLQPIADGLKLFFKEDFTPRGVDKVLFILAPALTVMPALISFAVIPWAGALTLSSGETIRFIVADVNIGIIYLIAVGSLGVYGVALGGWASNSKYSFIGGLRASAQMISYEIPLGLSILVIILMAGTINPYKLVDQQLSGTWFLLQQPVAAVLLYTCMLAEANRAPFDLAEAEAELVGGWHTEYSSMKWALFFLAEYAHLVVGSAFFALLFLGGWSINPFTGHDLPLTTSAWLLIPLQFGIVLGKVFLLIMLTMLIRWTLPRFRYDQLMQLAWQGMIPIALLILMLTSIWVYMGWTPYMWIASLIAIAIIWLVSPHMPKAANPNRRIPMIGSRFNPLRENEPLAD